MTENKAAVATPNMDMLNNAGGEGGGTESIMSTIHTIKVYNPAPGKEPEADKSGKFQIKEANTGDKKWIDGPLSYNILSILEVMSGECYPVDKNGVTSSEGVYFTSTEYSRYTRKEEPIGLRGGSKVLGFFPKAKMHSMLKSPLLNGETNFFYKKGKTIDGRPYDSSELSRSYVVYLKITSGEYKDQYARMFLKPQYFGSTWDSTKGEQCDAEEGTLLAAIAKAVPEVNKVREANGMNKVGSIGDNQVIVSHSIIKNEKGTFLSKIDYEGLQMMVGDNSDDTDYIHMLQQQHFIATFGEPTPKQDIIVDGGRATLEAVYQDYDKKKALAPAIEPMEGDVEQISIEDAEQEFGPAPTTDLPY